VVVVQEQGSTNEGKVPKHNSLDIFSPRYTPQEEGKIQLLESIAYTEENCLSEMF
jgi:hypothetical protein